MINKIVVGGFFHHNKHVLLLKRSRKEKIRSGFFEIPGGKIRPNETLVKALEREFMEETGISVKVIRPYHVFSYGSTKIKYNEIDFIVSSKSKKISVFLSDEHEKFVFVKRAEISNYKMSKEMKKSVIKGFDAVKQSF